MKILLQVAAASLACFAGVPAFARPAVLPAPDGLVPVEVRSVDRAWLRPGADFRPYTKVILEGSRFAFRPRWMRDMNAHGVSRLGAVTPADARAILDESQSGFDEIWAQAFRSAGYEVVGEPGEGVLRVRPRVANYSVNAPDLRTTGILRSYVWEAGEATLQLEVSDSRTGTILGRMDDHRHTARDARPQLAGAVTNRQEFGRLYETWATIATRSLGDLRASSPLPRTLQPGQSVIAR